MGDGEDASIEMSSSQPSHIIYEREEKIKIDYSGLNASLQDLEEADDVRKVEKTFEKQISDLNATIHKIQAPNMKAMQKLDEAREKLAEANKDFDTVRRKAKQAKQNFERDRRRSGQHQHRQGRFIHRVAEGQDEHHGDQPEGGVLLTRRCSGWNHHGHHQDAGNWRPHFQGADPRPEPLRETLLSSHMDLTLNICTKTRHTIAFGPLVFMYYLKTTETILTAFITNIYVRDFYSVWKKHHTILS